MYAALTWAAICAVAAVRVAATTVPLTFYTDSSCKTVSSITPNLAGNVSECMVTPGLVSLHFGFVGCASGGKATPYFFKDTACRNPTDILDGPTRTGDDFQCYTLYHATAVAVMLSCSTDSDNLEAPTATETVSVGPVATGAQSTAGSAIASSTPAASDASRNDNSFANGWNRLSNGAHIGIYAGAAVFAAIIAGLILWRRCWHRPPTHTYIYPPRPVEQQSAVKRRLDVSVREVTVVDTELGLSNTAHRQDGTPYPYELENVAPTVRQDGTPYTHVLENIAQTARQYAAHGVLDNHAQPPYSSYQMGLQSLPNDTIKAAFPWVEQDRDTTQHRMGAAGELFMFEYLQQLGLPNFGLGNWTSDIRGHVNEHPSYAHVPLADSDGAWTDIEYRDTHGVMTDFLIGHGYRQLEGRHNEILTYHFEVKATVSTSTEQPFFISPRQMSHIQSNPLDSGHVYVICRLTSMGRGQNTRLRILVDPGQALAHGDLPSERDAQGGWKVTPRRY